MTAWLQVTATTGHAVLAEAVFERFEAAAVSVLDAGTEMAVEHTPHEQPAFETSQVVGLFDLTVAPEPIEAALQEALGAKADIRHERLEQRDWATAWVSQHPPLCFGGHLWIAPHAAAVAVHSEDDVIVRLDPGLAFGTGAHATTALCLEWLAGQSLSGRRVLDYGCGSGILAIAAARLGAASVTAVDIDAQALRATRENAVANHVGEHIETPTLDGLRGAGFDIVLANILARPLIELAPVLTRLAAAEGAQLVLSGLLTRQIDAVRTAYMPQFAFAPPAGQDGWARLDATRRGSGSLL